VGSKTQSQNAVNYYFKLESIMELGFLSAPIDLKDSHQRVLRNYGILIITINLIWIIFFSYLEVIKYLSPDYNRIPSILYLMVIQFISAFIIYVIRFGLTKYNTPAKDAMCNLGALMSLVAGAIGDIILIPETNLFQYSYYIFIGPVAYVVIEGFIFVFRHISKQKLPADP